MQTLSERPSVFPFSIRHIAVGLVLLAAAAIVPLLTPSKKLVDPASAIDLETVVPRQFGNWRLDETIVPLRADPSQEALLKKLYSQILGRTYINDLGQRIMLSIAYGDDQSESMQVHKPEVCYPAQGFQVFKQSEGSLETGFGAIPVRHLVAAQGSRVEPITYWITIGGNVPDSAFKWKIEQLKYGLTGRIPDGMIFRVSSITPDESQAYRLQDSFVKELLAAMPAHHRSRLIGAPRM